MRFGHILASLVTAPFLLLCSFLSAQETNLRATVTVQIVDVAGSAISNALVGFQALKRRVKVSASGSQRFDLTLQVGMCADCGEIDSATGHPATVRLERTETKTVESTVSCTDRPYSQELPNARPACEKELFARRGRPFMFPARNGIAYGVSSDPDKASELNLWVDNQSAEPVSAISCCAATLFREVEVFDSDGRRVLSKADREAQKALSEGRELVQVCTCSSNFLIAPHTMQLFDFADISREYALKPGRYTITERNPPGTYNLITEANQRRHYELAGLVISIP